MITHRPLGLLISVLLAHAWEDSKGFGDAEHSHRDRPRRQRSTVGEPTDHIVVDHGAHAARFNVAGTHERSRRAHADSSDAPKEDDAQAVLDSMGLGKEKASFMKRQDLYEDEEESQDASGGKKKSSANDSHDQDQHILSDHDLLGEHLDDADMLLQEGDAAQAPWWDRRRRRRRVDCTYKSWTGWSACSKTCAGGTRSNKRGKNPAAHGGKDCAYAETQLTETCNPTPCPVDCSFRSWTGWSTCSLTCGSGQKTRTRTKNGPFHGGSTSACDHPTSQTLNCNEFSCPQNCYFQPWSEWGSCTKTCIAFGNYGYKTRDRGKVGPFFGGKACHGHTVDDGLCNSFTCPYDCEVAAWSTWSVCTQTCSVSTVTHGYKIRSRTSTAASNGGKQCAENWQMNHCNTQLCAFDCYFLSWGAWGPCSKTCTKPNEASGVRIRIRDKVGPGMGGKECHGPVTAQKSCNDFNCPIDCEWTEWGPFGECSKTCGVGGRTRERTRKEAQFGGAACVGPTQHTETCSAWKCPVNCRWTLWDAWMPCTKTCGGGLSHRSRSYDPRPQNGGIHCSGAHMEMIDCSSAECPIDCVWEDWMDWSLCSKSCGDGVRTRVRLVNISSSNGGKECSASGDPSQETPCPEVYDCPLDCRHSEWGNWSECNATCGVGQQIAERELLDAENGGSDICPEGELTKSQECESETPCAENIKAGAPSSFRPAAAVVFMAAAALYGTFEWL